MNESVKGTSACGTKVCEIYSFYSVPSPKILVFWDINALWLGKRFLTFRCIIVRSSPGFSSPTRATASEDGVYYRLLEVWVIRVATGLTLAGVCQRSLTWLRDAPTV